MFGANNNFTEGFQTGLSLYNLVSSIVEQFSTNKGRTAKPSISGGDNSHTIYDFLANFSNGVAKPTKYRLEFKLPKGVSGSSTSDADTAVLSGNIRSAELTLNKQGSTAIKCHTMTLPPRMFQTHEVKYNNSSFKLPYGVTYEPVTFTFYSSATLDTVRYFDIWQSAIMNYSNNTMNFFDEYVSDIDIYILNDEGNDVYGVTMFDAYPLGKAAVEYSYSASNTVLNVSVTFAYRYFLPMESTQRINRI